MAQVQDCVHGPLYALQSGRKFDWQFEYHMEGNFGDRKICELSAKLSLAKIKFGELLYGVRT